MKNLKKYNKIFCDDISYAVANYSNKIYPSMQGLTKEEEKRFIWYFTNAGDILSLSNRICKLDKEENKLNKRIDKVKEKEYEESPILVEKTEDGYVPV